MKFTAQKFEMQQLLQGATASGVEIVDVRKYVAAALAFSIAKSLTLPTQPVESISGYFRVTHEMAVMNLIGEVNELFPIDYEYARALARSFYSIRYTAAYPDCKTMSLSPYDFFCTVSGVQNFIDPESYAFITKYKTNIVGLSNALCSIME